MSTFGGVGPDSWLQGKSMVFSLWPEEWNSSGNKSLGVCAVVGKGKASWRKFSRCREEINSIIGASWVRCQAFPGRVFWRIRLGGCQCSVLWVCLVLCIFLSHLFAPVPVKLKLPGWATHSKAPTGNSRREPALLRSQHSAGALSTHLAEGATPDAKRSKVSFLT